MLILSRREGEEIKLGEDITVKIYKLLGDKVKLGVEAPESVTVHRAEVFDRIQRENQLRIHTEDESND